MLQFLERRAHRLMIGERQSPAGDDLTGLVALAGDDQKVAFLKHGASLGNGGAAVADIERAGRGGENCGADFVRRFAARIIVGDDHHIGETRRNLAHDRPFAGVAVAAAAEDHDEPPLWRAAADAARTFSSASGLCA